MHAAGGLLKLVAMLQPTAGADATATAGLQIDTKLRAGGAQQRDVFRELRGIKLLGTALAVGASAATPAAPKTLLSLIAALDAAVVGHRTNQRAALAAGALPALVAVARRLAVRRAPPEPELLPNAVLAIGSMIDGLAEGGAALKAGDGVELLVSLLRVQPPTETSALAMDALRAAGVEAPDALCRTLDALSPGKKKAAAGVTSLRVMDKMSRGKLRESRREALAALKMNKP